MNALAGIRQVHGKVDLERRGQVGALGEQLLVQLLEEHWPGAARHVSLRDDGLGYDIELDVDETTWKLEVKSTTRRNRLRIFLSRNEFTVASLLPEWRLVVVGLGSTGEIEAVATVTNSHVLTVAPEDTAPFARWESVSLELAAQQLSRGLSCVDSASVPSTSLLAGDQGTSHAGFAWMPD